MSQTLPSLLDAADLATPAVPPRTPLQNRLAAPLKKRWEKFWTPIAQDPGRKRRWVRGSRIAAGVLVASLGVGAYFLFRPIPQPDYATDGLDDVLDYTLMTDEFNRLPVKERLKLISELIARLKNMSSGDSVLMASFASGIAGTAREQIMENASRLAVDVWDNYAVQYAKVPDADREAALDNAFVEFTKMMEGLGGRSRDISDEERLAEGRRQADRDLKMMKDPTRGPSNKDLAQVAVFLDKDVGKHASAQQRMRGQQMMRDMTRRLRGQDITTGKPKDPR